MLLEGKNAVIYGADGEIHGQLTFEWMEGGFFLLQRVDIDLLGRRITGAEYVGYGDSNSC